MGTKFIVEVAITVDCEKVTKKAIREGVERAIVGHGHDLGVTKAKVRTVDFD